MMGRALADLGGGPFLLNAQNLGPPENAICIAGTENDGLHDL
jgi:hypothetical protein